MPASSPHISVIIPAYNRAHTIARAIESVRRQTIDVTEIIVVDDGSTDRLDDALCGIADGRICLLRHEENRGGAAARNTGIRHARGEYIAFLDSDDEWHDAKLEKQLAVFRQAPASTGVVYAGWRWIDAGKNRLITDKLPSQRGDLSALLLDGDCIGSLSTPLIKTSVLKSAGGFDARLPARQDWDLWLRLAQQCTFEYVPEVLVNYTVHASSISGDVSNKLRGTEMVLEKFHDEFSRHPSALAGQYLLLTIFYLLNDDTEQARTAMVKSLRCDPAAIKLYWKNFLHFSLSLLPLSVRRNFFRMMRSFNPDFYWIVGAE